MSQPVLRRRRGVILTRQGWQKFQSAKSQAESVENAGRRYTLEDLSDRTHLSVDTLTRILGKAIGVDKQSLYNCFQAFNLSLTPEDYTRPSPDPLTDQHSPAAPANCPTPESPLPGGQLAWDSSFYVNRPNVESSCYKTIAQPGALIRIQAAHQMGKTSLLARIQHQAIALGYHSIFVNLQLVPAASKENLDHLLRWFCQTLSTELGIPSPGNEVWDVGLGTKVSSMCYLEQWVLTQISQPIVLLIDEINQLFSAPDVTHEFLGLLRTWHEAAKNRRIWQHLRVVLAYTEHLPDPPQKYQSPFNIGLAIDLLPFTSDQVAELVQCYGLSATPEQVTQLTSLVGGHPYLAQVALYHLQAQTISWEELGQATLANCPIFQPYLTALPLGHHAAAHDAALPSLAELPFLTGGMGPAPLGGLAIVDVAQHRQEWRKVWSSAWWKTANPDSATLQQFWQGQPILFPAFVGTSQAVDLRWEEIAAWIPHPINQSRDRSYPALWQQTPLDKATPIVPMAQFGPNPDLPDLPEGIVRLDSPFYVEPSVTTRCYTTIAKPGGLIRIKAPRQMGKSSLMARIVHQATELGYHTVVLNLCQAEDRLFSHLDQFLRWFLACLTQKLRLPAPLDSDWEADRGSIFNCTTYLQEHILEQLDCPIVIALDDVDRVFQASDIAQGFLAMLRLWHEEAKTTDCWEQLRLIIAHSTEDYGRLDINQSPFNVGLPIELEELTPEQVRYLTICHHLDDTWDLVSSLMALVGGHPYLISLALYHLTCQEVALPQLLAEAATNTGIYEDHLRRHLATLQQQPDLAMAMQQVVTAPAPISLETMYTYQLYSMGLIKRQGNSVVPRCELYRQYFSDRLLG